MTPSFDLDLYEDPHLKFFDSFSKTKLFSKFKNTNFCIFPDFKQNEIQVNK
jgi:hypothetical protein